MGPMQAVRIEPPTPLNQGPVERLRGERVNMPLSRGQSSRKQRK